LFLIFFINKLGNKQKLELLLKATSTWKFAVGPGPLIENDWIKMHA